MMYPPTAAAPPAGAVDPQARGQAILDIICAEYAVSPAVLTSPSRDPFLVEARYVAATALRTCAGWSLTEIGTALCRDHTTIMHGLAKIARNPALYGTLLEDVARQAGRPRTHPCG